MKGFFSKEKPKTRKQKAAVKKESKTGCDLCGLHTKCKSPKMKYTGKGKKDILIIAEAPGRSEDEDWKELDYPEPTQLIGEAGQLLRIKAEPHDIDLDEDCYKTNSICCRPPKNRTPTKKEIKCCKQKLEETVEETKPKFIWLFGSAAIEAFFMDRYNDSSNNKWAVNRWRGLCIPDRKTGAWILPMFHPSYLLRKDRDKNLESTFERDLKFAVSCLEKKPSVFDDFESQVKLLYDIDEVTDHLEDILENKYPVIHDYETNALKPYWPGSKVWTIAVNGKVFAYDYPHWDKSDRRKIRILWKKIQKDPKINKVAQNIKFEDAWTRNIFDVVVQGWHWCTMNASHIIDSRGHFTTLDFQAFIRYGFSPYDQHVKKYKKSKAGSRFNTLDQVPLNDLLLYCGIDERITKQLWKDQEKELSTKRGLKKAYNFFHKGLVAFSDTQQIGIPIDSEYYEKEDVRLEKKISQLEHKLLNGKEALLFKKETGNELKLQKDFSTKDLRELFFNVLKLKPTKKTATDLASVDHDVLSQMNNPFAKRIIQRRKLFKVKNTYLAQFKREECEGRIHPFFDLHIPRSYRSSSSQPNFQNIPVRDEEARKAVRRGVIPSKGRKLGLIDYSGTEVCAAACYSKDPVLVKEIEDGICMHRNMAKKLFKLTEKQVTKDIRFYAKNQFVFPEFYGSYYFNCAMSLIETCFDLKTNDGITVRKHLKNKGIVDQDDFVDHVKKEERKFWNKYNVYYEWKEQAIKDYQKKGYIETFFGHRRTGYLSNNQILNTPMQATGFHWLLWSYIEANRESKNWETDLIAQIHDEMIYDMEPREESLVWGTTKDIMCNRIRERYDWIIVPLTVEIETTPVDGSWYEKEEIKYDR